MKKGTFYFAFLILFLHCEEKKTVVATQKPRSAASDQSSQSKTADSPANISVSETEKVLQKIDFRKNETVTKLRNSSPEQANQLYLKFRSDNQEDIAKLEELETKILEDYYLYWDKPKPDHVKKTEKLLDNYGFEFWEIGEGITEIREKPDYYQKIFKNKLTPDFAEYVNLLARDDEQLFQADAAISVPRSEVQQRTLNWENFLKKYPETQLKKEAWSEYQFYLYAFLLGFDNTPTLEHQTGEIYPENIKEFQSFIKKYPDTKAAAAATILLANPKTTSEERKILLKEYLNEDQINW